MAERSAADRSRQAASNTPRAATRMPIGLLTACGVFLLFIVLALNGSYAGTFFFWTGLLVSPFVGAIASITNGRRHRPLAIVGVATATAITL
jgi:hypothetical protein